MEIRADEKIVLKPIDKENAILLFPLFKADLKEISRWFPFGEDYIVDYDLAYVDEKKPPFDETFVIYCDGVPCGRAGLYDYDKKKNELFIYYWVATPYRRKHIAATALNAVLNYLKTLGVHRVLFDVKNENVSSISFLTKLNAVIAEENEKYTVYSYALSTQQSTGLLLPNQRFG